MLAFKFDANECQFKFSTILEFKEPRIDLFLRLFDNYYLFIFGDRFELHTIVDSEVSIVGEKEQLTSFCDYLKNNIDIKSKGL